jgi:hypothetical protein
MGWRTILGRVCTGILSRRFLMVLGFDSLKQGTANDMELLALE